MEIQEVTPEVYERFAPEPYVVFNTVKFNQHVAPKCEAVKHLIVSPARPRLGLIAGVRENRLLSPFSAPYGGFSFLVDHVRIEEVLEAVNLLDEYARQLGVAAVKVTLPPTFYDETFIAKQANAFVNAGYQLETLDLNSAFDLRRFDANYPYSISKSARNALNNAIKHGLQFCQAQSAEEKALCYALIRERYEAKGRGVKMPYEEVLATSQIIPADFFLVRHAEEAVAAAIVFRVTLKVAQVIYWGSPLQYDPLHAMHFLAFRMFETYKNRQFEIVDIGPSSLDSQPNTGLLFFKESMGCELTQKLGFRKEIRP